MASVRILIVDDEDELVSALVERLNLRGFEAEGVTTGAEALIRLANTPFDVVLLDVKMPELGGLEVIKRIKEKRPDLEVILLTGHSSAQDAEKAKALGAFDYLVKPVKIDDLIRILLLAGAQREEDESRER
jgi:two-component system OmpR family response regulator